MLLALFMVGSVSALGLGVSTPVRAMAHAVRGPDTITSMESFPDEGSPVPRVHPLEIPFVWFGLQLLELGILTVLFRLSLPRDWPWASTGASDRCS